MAKIVKFMAVNTSSYPKEDFHLQKNSSSYMVLQRPNDNVMVTRIIQENHPSSVKQYDNCVENGLLHR